MTFFSKLSPRVKIYLGFGIIIMSIIILIVTSYFSLKHIQRSQNEIDISHKITRSLTELQSIDNHLRALMLELIYSNKVSLKDSLKKEIQVHIHEAQGIENRIKESLRQSSEEYISYAEIESLRSTFAENRNHQYSLIAEGKIDELTEYTSSIQYPLFVKIQGKFVELEKKLDETAVSILEESKANSRQEIWLILIIGFAITLICLTLGMSLIKLLRKIVSEIVNGVSVLNTSSAEILSTVSEISTGATETSTAISETTTTVEEVRQTAMVASQKANVLMESSQRATDSAEKGLESVQHVIDSMKKIDKQMNVIAETVVKLSEQNRSIGEITSTVTDIADQSNLLAVNAAIEAAKAGEQGRGFAVVAQEIRSLADQSKKATIQIKEILNEIQKSVNNSVDVTEKGSNTVAEGILLVTKSGEAIGNLAEHVEESVQIAVQISSSSQQQMAGMDQVVPAMENIKQASEQNVAGIRQAQATANDLNELGRKLQGFIEIYNL